MRSYWKATIAILAIFAMFLTVRLFSENPFQKSKIPPFSTIPRELDLAGGPEREERGFPKREIVDLITMYPDLFIASGSREEKKVALTFDDGPDDVFTPQILDVLKDKGVKASFFVIGKRVEAFPEVMERMAKEGHLIANHTWSHPEIMKLPLEKVQEEILKTEEVLKPYFKDKKDDLKLFRPPYGSIDPEKVEFIAGLGYKIISWDVDSLDWKGLSAAEVKTNILENVINGSIILQHSAGGVDEDLSGSVEALPEIIDVLKKDDFEFVTIDKLLKDENEKEKMALRFY